MIATGSMTLSEIKIATAKLEALLDASSYVSHKEAADTLSEVTRILPRSLKDKLSIYFNLRFLLPYLRLVRLITTYPSYHRRKNNEIFIANEMERRRAFFDTVTDFPLDDQQRRAVIANEDNNLVLASAGSGKTMTIVAKIKYLTKILGVPAESILPISFTRKSADEMKKRINTKGISPQTFHKFGFIVVQSVERRKPKIFDESKLDDLLRGFLKELIKDRDYLQSLNDFLLNYTRIPKSQFDFNSLGDYIQYMKDQNFTTYRQYKMKQLFKGKETFRNEVVKSIEECIIANHLTLNKVDYEYEKLYEYPYANSRKKNYRPDFTIKTPTGEVYLEHLGMDRDGNVPAFFAGINESHQAATHRYQQLLDWKREVHAQNNTKLIESYSYEFQEGTLIANLNQRLEEAGVVLRPMSPDEIWNLILESSKDQVDGFIELCKTFLALLKSNGHMIEGVRRLNDESGADEFTRLRSELFINLFEPLYHKYESYLIEKQQIDFSDMITKATDYISTGRYRCPLKYVIVDEFQDLSVGRYRILDAIREQNPDVRFYCVGDDWQSIFRFAGSDITLFSDFEKHFGPTYQSKIETTYRFNDPLIQFSTAFILKNPHQLPKTIHAPDDSPPTHYTVLESESSDNDSEALVKAFDLLIEQGLKATSTIFIIGRYNFDIQRLKPIAGGSLAVNLSDNRVIYTPNTGRLAGQSIEAGFITAHKSKGLEADYSILINCNSGKFGFPSGRADDPVLNLLLSSADQFQDSEERRLFYVAMTRAKRHVVFIADKYRKSKFIQELTKGTGVSSHSGCPKCGSGQLVKRSGSGYLFYGCTNWAYGCDYSTSKPPI